MCSKYTTQNVTIFLPFFQKKIDFKQKKQWNESPFLHKQQQKHPNQTKTTIITYFFIVDENKPKKLYHVGHDQPSSGVVQVTLLEGGDGTHPGKHAYKCY